MWGAQIQYDTHYEANDTFHTFFKGIHIGVFLCIGSW